MPSSEHQQKFTRLQQHVAKAYASKTFYRKLYDDAGVHPDDIRHPDDVRRLPTINKDLLIRDQQAALPFGSMDVDINNLARVNLIASCLYMCLTHEDQAAVTEMFTETFGIMGLRAGDLVDIASAYHWVQGGTQMDAAVRAIGAAVIPGGPGQSEQRVRVLKETGATVIQAFTGYAEDLASRFASYGIDPARDLKVRLLIIGGELRDRSAKKRLEDSWGGAKAREYYGVSEAGILAAECHEVGDGMHISSRCMVEVVDPVTGQPVPEGQAGEIVTTELVRSAQPFIRYRTGDITKGISTAPCACGRTSFRLGHILGRSSDIPRIKGLFIAPAMIDRAVKSQQGVGSWRAVIDRRGNSDEVTLHVELTETASPQQDVQQALMRRLKETVGITFGVETVPSGAIDLNSGRIEDRRRFA